MFPADGVLEQPATFNLTSSEPLLAVLALTICWYLGVNPKIGGKPPKWMVYNRKPIEMDDLGVPLFLEIPK